MQADATVRAPAPLPAVRSFSTSMQQQDGVVLLAAASVVHILHDTGFTAHLPPGMVCDDCPLRDAALVLEDNLEALIATHEFWPVVVELMVFVSPGCGTCGRLVCQEEGHTGSAFHELQEQRPVAHAAAVAAAAAVATSVVRGRNPNCTMAADGEANMGALPRTQAPRGPSGMRDMHTSAPLIQGSAVSQLLNMPLPEVCAVMQRCLELLETVPKHWVQPPASGMPVPGPDAYACQLVSQPALAEAMLSVVEHACQHLEVQGAHCMHMETRMQWLRVSQAFKDHLFPRIKGWCG